MPDPLRSCDRCCSLKTQCNGSRPCRRCARLQIPCLRDRPYRPRGRPRKLPTTTTRRSPAPLATQEADSQASAGAVTSSGVPNAVVAIASPDWLSDDNVTWTAPDTATGPSKPSSEHALETGESPPVDTQTDATCCQDGGDGEHCENSDRDSNEQNDHVDGHDPVHVNNTLRSVSETSSGTHQPSSTDSLAVATPRAWSSSAWTAANHQPNPTSTPAVLDHHNAQALVEGIVSHAQGLGIFKILDHSQLRAALATNGFVDTGRSPGELSLALVAIAIELEPGCLSVSLQDERDMLVDTLRIEFLKRVPSLAWKTSDLSLSQCAALVLASHTWSLKEDLVQIAHRWNSLSRLIWNEIRTSQAGTAKSELTTSIGRAIQLQATVLDLLHHSRLSWPVGLERDVGATHTTQMSASPGTEFGFRTNGVSDSHEYFSIFVPLVRLLQAVLSSPRDIDSMGSIRDSLEQYFLDFPPDLLEYSSVQYLYQLEAMIWFHGIFILTFIRQDLLEILIDETLPLHDEFYFALEHSILLGEAFPTLLQLDSSLQKLSPATVFFINLSSTIMASAMWQFHSFVDIDTSKTAVIDTPESLAVNVTCHQQVAEALSSPGSRYDVSLVRAVSDTLSILCTGLDSESYQILQASLDEIAHYRWNDDGHGISRLAVGSANGVVQIRPVSGSTSSDCQLQLPPIAPAEDAALRRRTIQALCSPDARICQGCFDLSIQF